MELVLCMDVTGGGGTRYDCLGGLSPSERSTFTYMFKASPSECSGSHARRRDSAFFDFEDLDEEDVGRESGAGFCWRRAM